MTCQKRKKHERTDPARDMSEKDQHERTDPANYMKGQILQTGRLEKNQHESMDPAKTCRKRINMMNGRILKRACQERINMK